MLTPWNHVCLNVRQAGISGFMKARLPSPLPSPAYYQYEGDSLNHFPQWQSCRHPKQRPKDTSWRAHWHCNELSSRTVRSLGAGYPQCCQLHRCDWRSSRQCLSPVRYYPTRYLGIRTRTHWAVPQPATSNSAPTRLRELHQQSPWFPPVSKKVTLQKEPFQAQTKQSWSDNKN